MSSKCKLCCIVNSPFKKQTLHASEAVIVHLCLCDVYIIKKKSIISCVPILNLYAKING